MADPKDLLLTIAEMVESRRQNFDTTYQDIVDLVRPNTQDFNRTSNPGEVRTQCAYDGTAINACLELASGLHSYLTNPSERFFTLGVMGMSPDQYDEEALAWLEIVSESIYAVYGKEESGFNTALHECYLDIGAFGTSCPYQYYSQELGSVRFRAFAIADVYFREDSDGRIDHVARRILWNKRQIAQEFGEAAVPTKIAQNKQEEREYTVWHLVCPRKDRVYGKQDAGNKKFASYYVCEDTKEMISEGGYDELPYSPGRWFTFANEIYGVGPARNCLPEIRMLNVMERTLIKASQKRADPPIQVTDEGFMDPIETAPGSLIYRESGVEPAELLQFTGDIQWSVEHAEQKRNYIRKCFYFDWLKMEKENKEMTAFEVADRRNEKLQLLAPNASRIQGEQLSPMIRRTYNLLHQRGYFPPAPPSLIRDPVTGARRRLMVAYISPAARAQMAIKANEMGRYVQEITPLIQIYPDIIDAVDFDKLAKKLADYRQVTRVILRTDEQIAARRAEKQQQQQMAQMAQIAEPASKALKNVADAQAKGLELGL